MSEFEVGAEDAGERLDKYVGRILEIPRSRAQRWIRQEAVKLDGKTAKVSSPIAEGQRILVIPPLVKLGDGVEPQPGDLNVLFEDQHLLILDKPAGLAVHPGAGRPRDTLVNYLLHHYPEIQGVGGLGRPGIVHRLDLNTTGVLVVARTDEAYQALSRAFSERRIDKQYLAMVHGCPRTTAGTFDAPIGRHPRDRKMMTVLPQGRPAVSHYRLRRNHGKVLSILEIGLETGRTHQIRVHCKHGGMPLIGDPVYGEARWRSQAARVRRLLSTFPRPALHSYQLTFEHPVAGGEVSAQAAVPADMQMLWLDVSGEPWPQGADQE